MANQRDINRWQLGKGHWNQWTEDRLNQKAQLKMEKKWKIDKKGTPLNDETRNWIANSTVDFSGFRQFGRTDFSEFIFPFDANFEKAYFSEPIKFNSASFKGKAWFNKARFEGQTEFVKTSFEDGAYFNFANFQSKTRFNRTEFRKEAQFSSANFGSEAQFINTKFQKITDFIDTHFQSVVWFQQAKFKGMATYRQANFHSNAMFQRAIFSHIADFQQSKFERTAKFQSTRFSSSAWFNQCVFSEDVNFNKTEFFADATFNAAKSEGSFSLAKAKFERVPDFIQMSFHAPARLDDLEVVEANPFQKLGGKERAARYRALKKIAIESHDHVREQEFFVSELRERRGIDDPFLSPSYILSFIYELLSDFGTSLKRPLAGLLGTWLVMAAAYGTLVPATTRQGCSWTTSWMAPEHYLSLLHTLPFVGLVRSGRRELALKCLYGSEKGFDAGTDVLFIAHNTFSSVLIFLFFLAVRNHFKIK